MNAKPLAIFCGCTAWIVSDLVDRFSLWIDIATVLPLYYQLAFKQGMPLLGKHMSRVTRKPVFGISDPYDTNRTVQQQKMTRGLKFGFGNKRDCTMYVASTKPKASHVFS